MTGAVPVDANVTDCVDVLFSPRLPNVKLAGLTVSVGSEAAKWSAKFMATLPPVAVNITV